MASPLNSTGFSDALVILGAAGLVIPAFARAKISPVIGFILVGLLVGPSGLGALVPSYPWLYHITISDPHAIEPFAEFGIVLLLFSIGLELSFKRLWSMRRLVFGTGAAELIGSGLILGTGLHLLTDVAWTGSFALGIALALSSTALVLPIAGTSSPVGRTAFAMLLFEDLALVPIIFILGALGPMAAAGGWMGFARVGGGAILTVAILFVGGRFFLPKLFAQAARTKSPELFLAASLLVVIAASLATTAAGLSPIVGALIAGLLIAETNYHSEVEVMTAPFKGLALGVFLITVGMSVDLGAIVADWGSYLLAIIAVVAIKALVTFGLLRLAGIRGGVAAETGMLMGSPSETTLIVLGAAGQAQLLAPGLASFWQTVTAIGLTITPLLALLGKRAAKRIERRQGDSPEASIPEEGPGTVVIGFGRVGRMVCDMLKVHGQPYVAVEADIDAVKAARADGYPVIFGDVVRPELVDRLNLGRARALILTMDDPVLSVALTRRVRGWVPDLTIIARARDTAHAAELYKAGASDAVPETLESSLQLAEAVLTDLGVAVGPVIVSIHEKRAELRQEIKAAADLEVAPRLIRARLSKD
ncbi:CPA2 family monovalent cation:H+ antiporter-2 [Sphingomonas sp. BE270]|jgi:CPA2 family monovalent cation:H+ antiporter-2|uniref:cation:proton antiporter domain-containing protein n=1 Tax=unclassified Sphingomonas TaxID=196159 RepID=UPI00053F06C5|nr:MULTISPECIES: cation:proton antiporter [unclassified Sphingomonas]MDR6849017.1 CPA2 family monovalent cation:H+ antiporter-2 [Sphingomonas sp. BE137]MDR7257985.1 CPA2 family monovalent cation:H+ antiporter-2 [Sphingomonas sp. BE270]